VEGAPSTTGSERRHGKVFQEDGESRITLEAVEAAFDVEERGGGPAGDLVGRGLPPGDLDSLAAVVAKRLD